MQAYSLAQEFCPDRIDYSIGYFIGEGADGDVYHINNLYNKAIKFSVIYDIDFTNQLEFKYKDIFSKLTYIYNSNLDLFAKVSDMKLLHIGYRNTVTEPQQFLLHYYVMEKLKKISEDEKKIIHTIFSHEDLNIKKEYSAEKLENLLEGLSRGLDFDIKKIMLLKSKIEKSDLHHTDIHVRNVMKDRFGNFKLIDLDRLKWSNE